MPKISPLGQNLWPTGREQTDRQTHTKTEKANTEDPCFTFYFFFIFDFLLKGAVRFKSKSEVRVIRLVQNKNQTH